MNNDPNMIERSDGTIVNLSKLPPRDRLAHDLVEQLHPKAKQLRADMIALKQLIRTEMIAFRDMMLSDYELTIGGKEGGFSVKSACGTKRISLSIGKNTSFGPELVAATELINQWLDEALQGSSDDIRAICDNAFKPNRSGKLNTAGILGLKNLSITHPTWLRAMDAIDEAVINDVATSYFYIFDIDTEKKDETRVELNFAKL